jgi:predicted small metal-binding protein
MKTLACRDVGFDCDAQIHASTEEEVLAQAADHASRAHGVTVTPEMAESIKPLIHEDAV